MLQYPCIIVLGDGTGISKMLMNWLTLMGNPNAAVPAMHSYDKDPFAPLESAYEFAEDLTTETWEEILHNIHLQEEREDHPREVRTVYLPGSLVSRMRAEAVEELAQRRKRGEDVPDFLSENDILSAWWIKVCIISFAIQHRANDGFEDSVHGRRSR